ncbi:head-tail connector protein [Polaromonas jejuensis]|uniref:Head-tail connector protein n=1 Tax=Polaromonas jejuensis TaxID=457502 RepID=A0ABW0QHE2_9BURK|nr:head-tail connector protein [Polaromonas jejuensis]
MALKLTTAPTAEPVTLAEAKAHLRVDVADDDLLITNLITAARVHAENVCRRAFVTQKWDLYLDSFPKYTYYGVVPGYVPVDQLPSGWLSMRNYAVRFRGGKIDLPFPPLQSVDAVKYTDLSGVVQTLATNLYVVDNISEPGAITPAPDTYWPDTQNRVNAVQISFTAGYGAAAAVPAGIKAWILMRIGALYENREEVLVGQRLVVADLPFVDGLLDPYRIAGYV